MQLASNAFDEAIRKPLRNRGYIKVSIGVVNSDAQNNAELSETPVTYFSSPNKVFDGYSVSKTYVTAEHDWSKVDGSMYFLPPEDATYNFYNNGIVTNGLLGRVKITFGELSGLDIKGLTIDFGECYPTKFTIESDSGTKTYENNKSLFTTEDTFDGTSFFIITPLEMLNGQNRLRINQFTCGIANIFSNEKVKSCSTKEYVSSISDTIPSMDTTIIIDNQDLYYSVDNPESVIAYMEVGQEVKVTFGYDVTGNGDIEWLNDTTTYLNTWRANDQEAEFSSTDRFYQLNDTFYGGKYRPQGITLYNLAIEVLNDAGIEDSRQYAIDSYLKKITVYNPMPVVSHAEALQIIANAGRCVLYEDRANRIHLKSSFVPDMVATSDDKTAYSNMEQLLKDTEKKAYAVTSNDFSKVDGSMYFMPEDSKQYFSDMGYISNSIADADGIFATNPKITINLESGFVAYGLNIEFRSVAPKKFNVITYYEGVKVAEKEVNNPDVSFITEDRFEEFDKMEIIFTKGYPNSRIFIDNIIIGDVTNYTIKENELSSAPTGERQQKVKSIVVSRETYREYMTESAELLSEDVDIKNLLDNNEYIVYFSEPSYGFTVNVKDNSNVTVAIMDQSNYFVRVRFYGITTESTISISVAGKEYAVDESFYRHKHNENGQEITWSNPLISTVEHARDLEEWLASYYLGDVDYEITWRGDPRVESNDLFYLERKNRDKALIRSYENTLEFNGAWSGTMKARKVVLKRGTN